MNTKKKTAKRFVSPFKKVAFWKSAKEMLSMIACLPFVGMIFMSLMALHQLFVLDEYTYFVKLGIYSSLVCFAILIVFAAIDSFFNKRIISIRMNERALASKKEEAIMLQQIKNEMNASRTFRTWLSFVHTT